MMFSSFQYFVNCSVRQTRCIPFMTSSVILLRFAGTVSAAATSRLCTPLCCRQMFIFSQRSTVVSHVTNYRLSSCYAGHCHISTLFCRWGSNSYPLPQDGLRFVLRSPLSVRCLFSLSGHTSYQRSYVIPSSFVIRLTRQVSSAQARTSQKDISPLTVKRVIRRTKLKDDVMTRDQVCYKVSAFATAEEYNLETLGRDVQNYGYCIVQMPEDAFDALHVEALSLASDEPRRIFFFREGSIVFWNVPEMEQSDWLARVQSHQEGSYDDRMTREEQETLEFTYTNNESRLASGDIELYRPINDSEKSVQHLDMFAFSNALSLSVKLAVWETLLGQYVDSIEWVLQDLKDGKKIRMSEDDVLRKAGELFTLSHLINLSSDLLDTPDFYWDREELEKLYNKTCNYLNIARRTRVMNEKLGQCVELTELLRDHLKDKHHTRLELMIIILITIEVGFAVFHLFERHYLHKGDKRFADD